MSFLLQLAQASGLDIAEPQRQPPWPGTGEAPQSPTVSGDDLLETEREIVAPAPAPSRPEPERSRPKSDPKASDAGRPTAPLPSPAPVGGTVAAANPPAPQPARAAADVGDAAVQGEPPEPAGSATTETPPAPASSPPTADSPDPQVQIIQRVIDWIAAGPNGTATPAEASGTARAVGGLTAPQPRAPVAAASIPAEPGDAAEAAPETEPLPSEPIGQAIAKKLKPENLARAAATPVMRTEPTAPGMAVSIGTIHVTVETPPQPNEPRPSPQAPPPRAPDRPDAGGRGGISPLRLYYLHPP